MGPLRGADRRELRRPGQLSRDQAPPLPPREESEELQGVEGRIPDPPFPGGPGGIAGGVVGGVVGGASSPMAAPVPDANGVFPWGSWAERPHKISGRTPQYTREANDAHIEGMMLVRCVITAQGAVTSCRVIKSLPPLDQEVVSALQSQRYAPVMYKGQAVSVAYVFPFRFKRADSIAAPPPAAPPRP